MNSTFVSLIGPVAAQRGCCKISTKLKAETVIFLFTSFVGGGKGVRPAILGIRRNECTVRDQGPFHANNTAGTSLH